MQLRGKTLCATFFHAPRLGAVEVLEHALVAVDSRGNISSVSPRDDPGYEAERSRAAASGALVELGPQHYVLPGFIDLHIHAPQYPQLGVALDAPLEVWLQRYTFPLEARYADLDFARTAYGQLLDDLAANGTTTAVMFATIHLEATKLLADLAIAKGMRALVGKVVMDDPASCPPYYRDTSAEAGIDQTQALIDYIRSHPDNGEGRVLPAITPRFIPSCSDEALAGLGRLAGESQCHVQTHCSESDWEHGYVIERMGRSDTEALDQFGLLTRRSVLAHSNLISQGDMEIIASRGAAVAHCPLSNAYFSNAVFPLRVALEKGLHVGLGTDISGGPSASLFDAQRMCVAASRMLEDGVDPARPKTERGRPNSRVDWKTAFHLATAGGGKALDLPIGTFEVDQQFDAMVIDAAAPSGTVRLIGDDLPLEDILARILYTASKPNISSVIVSGEGI